MSAVVTDTSLATEAAPAEWQVVAVYEDQLSRQRAMHLLRTLERSFAGELTFCCSWWRFRYLAEPDIALVARHYAVAADIIVFATASPGLFPLSVMSWIESWTALRRKPAGVLVPLIGSPNIPSQLYSTKQFYLRHVAERAGMDYLPHSLLADELHLLNLPEELLRPANPANASAPDRHAG